jgi:hypothetical protein
VLVNLRLWPISKVTMPMFSALLITLIATQATPQQMVRSNDGAQWAVTVNDHGAVLRSGRQVIYLGHSCDARSPTLGRGTWDYANGGFRILIGRRNLGFARQAIDGLTYGPRCLAQ